MLLDSLVISHIQYPAILVNGISQFLITILEKQLNWDLTQSSHLLLEISE